MVCITIILLLFNLVIIFFSKYSIIFISVRVIKEITFKINIFIFVISLSFWYFYDSSILVYQYLYTNQLGYFTFQLGIDGYSLFFIIITTFIFPICLLTEWENRKNTLNRLVYFLLAELFLILTFNATDLFLFFISFEATTIPIFLLIGTWGSYPKRIKAAIYFFFFTFVTSLFFLYGVLFIYTVYGTSNYLILKTYQIPFSHQLVLWCCFFLPFASKAPLFPFHIWIPEAHVEAPTSGSILLAALMLKLALYGYLRFVIDLCFNANIYFRPALQTLLIVGLFYTTLTTIRQVDLKRIIAYSSITHMTYAMLGIITCTEYSIVGSIYLSLAHGLSASALFFIVGVLYQRGHTRLLNYYSGVCVVMPCYCILLFIFCAANFSLPLTMNFIGEYIVLIGLVQSNFFLALLSLFGVFGSVVYSLWFFNRVAFGNLRLNSLYGFTDITRREVYLLLPLLFYTFYFGIATHSIISIITPVVSKQVILNSLI